MGLRQTFKFVSLLMLLCSFALAQTQPTDSDADKAKKNKEQDERVVQLLDQAIGEAVSLRLPQNRAVVYAMAGDMYWKFDEKRARELFRSSAGELVSYNQEAEKERREVTAQNMLTDLFEVRSDIRAEILPLVAAHDAELALELLVQTRPAKLAEAMARAAMPNKPTNDLLNLDRVRVGQELALEQQFALLAADENPDKAIKLIKDSLSKGISASVLPLLQKLNKKDEKKATELAGEVIKKLVDADMTKGFEDLQVAMSFLQFASKPPPAANAKEKQFAFTDAQIKDLANKLADAFLNGPKTLIMNSLLTSALSMLEKFVHGKIALLKQRKTENEANMPQEFKQSMELQKLFDPSASPEDILAQLPKLSSDFEKSMAYQSLSGKIGEIEDETRAKKLIDQIPDEKTKANLLEQFESTRIARTAAAGKLDDARKLIGNLSNKKTQIERLVALAMDFHRKGGEKDIENAKALMKDARALAPEYAETIEDMNDVMEVVKGYAVIEPDSAFRMFEPIIDRLNEHVQASATLARFNPKSTNFAKGELVLSVNGRRTDTPLFQYIPHMQMLGKADLDRMNVASNRFARSDAKAIVKLYVLQGFLRDDKKPIEKAPGQPLNIVFN
ncbi:MAG: hypothetical protein IPG22_13000 [Acidobacteria bacterium]|nr:hypothetical protein [Acidobacteriota bacterium]